MNRDFGRRKIYLKKLVALCLLCLHATAAFGQGDNDGMKTLESASRDKVKSSTHFELVDVEKLAADHYADAVKSIDLIAKPKVQKCDLLIVGGGMGGVAAAISACAAGLNVAISEPTSWLGGQLSSQGVSALDENYLVESSGATKTYKALRNSIRDYYKALGAEDGGARFEPHLDPGNCWVSRLAFEPKVAVKLLSDLLQPYITSGHLKIFLRTAPFVVRKSTDKIRAVQFVDFDSGKLLEMRCKFCIDASELGDLLPLAGMRYRSGAESKSETGEIHAPENANHDNVQDFTYPFVVEFCPGESHVIEKPPFYDEFNKSGKFSLFGYRMFENSKTINEHGRESEYLPFWEYRRLIDKSNFAASVFPHDLAMINWDSNDLRGENIIDQVPLTMAQRLSRGKYLSFGFLYWMQTEMPRDEGGFGYPELKLRPDIIGTADGVSMYPYIRESRRIVPRYTIVEEDIVSSSNPLARARLFNDSVGIGLYPVDIHGQQDVPGAGQATRPFQIPAAALLQGEIRNYLPACKNIGTTHVTNGAYRLHPIEWAIGEAAGIIAAEVLSRQTDILRLYKNKRALRTVQDKIVNFGAPIFWFDDVAPEHPAFAAIQFLSVSKLMPANLSELHFRPDEAMTRGEMAESIAKLLRLKVMDQERVPIADLPYDDSLYESFAACYSQKLMQLSDDGNAHLDRAVSTQDMQELAANKLIRSEKFVPKSNSVVSRADFAVWLYRLAKEQRFWGHH